MGNANSCCGYPRISRASDPAGGHNANGKGKKKRKTGRNGSTAGGPASSQSDGRLVDSAVDRDPGQGSGYPHSLSVDGGLASVSRREESVGNLQHISEREPDDWAEDPSLHPTTETMFMEKSKQSIHSALCQGRCCFTLTFLTFFF